MTLNHFQPQIINQKYKGITNYDFSKQRKNIVVSFVYGACTSKERENLKKYSDFIYMNKLIEKYEVLPILLNEMEIQIDNIAQCISRLQSNNSVFYTDFKKFLSKIFIICYQKCNLVFDIKWLVIDINGHSPKLAMHAKCIKIFKNSMTIL